ncbi:NADH dehydrogenase [ubiquinone] flavoprotein 1, mitochondrial [Tanacetum coccineum]
MVKYRDDHKRVLEGSESTTIADIVGFVNEKYPHLPKINLVYEDNGEKFVLDDFNIMMEESKDAAVIINVLLKERYGVYCVRLGIEVAAISPIAERTDYHRLLMGIAVGAFLVNLTDYHRYKLELEMEGFCAIINMSFLIVTNKGLLERHYDGVRGGWGKLFLLRLLLLLTDKSTNVVDASARISYFCEHESYGQYTPFREDTGSLWMITERMKVDDAKLEEIDVLKEEDQGACR